MMLPNKESIYERYRKASNEYKTTILDDLCRTLRCHRKHATRLMSKRKQGRFKKPELRGRKR